MPTATAASSVVDMDLKNRAIAVVITAGLAVGVSACGGDPEICADVDALRADLDDAKAIELQPGSLADLSTALDEVEADVDRLAESAATEYENEIEAVQSASGALTTSVETAVQAPSGPAITRVSADFGAVTTAVGNLREAVGDTC
jgi:hypothetical protein